MLWRTRLYTHTHTTQGVICVYVCVYICRMYVCMYIYMCVNNNRRFHDGDDLPIHMACRVYVMGTGVIGIVSLYVTGNYYFLERMETLSNGGGVVFIVLYVILMCWTAVICERLYLIRPKLIFCTWQSCPLKDFI